MRISQTHPHHLDIDYLSYFTGAILKIKKKSSSLSEILIYLNDSTIWIEFEPN